MANVFVYGFVAEMDASHFPQCTKLVKKREFPLRKFNRNELYTVLGFRFLSIIEVLAGC